MHHDLVLAALGLRRNEVRTEEAVVPAHQAEHLPDELLVLLGVPGQRPPPGDPGDGRLVRSIRHGRSRSLLLARPLPRRSS